MSPGILPAASDPPLKADDGGVGTGAQVKSDVHSGHSQTPPRLFYKMGAPETFHGFVAGEGQGWVPCWPPPGPWWGHCWQVG